MKIAIKKSIVELNEGDILIFRADLIHAGSFYNEEENTRLHVFLDSPVFPRIKNQTWLIHKHASREMKAQIFL